MSQKILGVIVAKYPYEIGEPFFEGELLTLSRFFDRIFIIVPEAQTVNREKQVFKMPDNAESLPINNTLSNFNRLRGVMKLFTLRAIKHLYEIRFRYQLGSSLPILKTMLAYEAKDISFRRLLLQEIKKRNLDIDRLYLYSYWLNEYTFSLVKIKKERPALKVFSRVHGWDLYFERHKPPYLPYRDYIIPELDKLFPISENGREYLLSKVPECDPGRVVTQRLGTDVGNQNYNYNMGKVVLLSLSFIRPIKHLELLIETLESMDEFDIEWHHLGGGEDNYADNLMNFAKAKLGNNSKVKYTFHGTLSKVEIEAFLKNTTIDLMINTSYFEGIPVSIMQAMAFSIPAIAPDIGGMNEIIDNNENGYLLSSSPVCEELKMAIGKYFHLEGSGKKQLRNLAYKTWDLKFNAMKNYQELAGLMSGIEC